MILSGVIPPLTTPFENGRIAPARLREIIERYEPHGPQGYLALGSTGEAALLEEDEKLALLRAARAAIPAGKPLLAGVGLESTAATIRLAGLAAGCRADLLLVLTPHYYQPHLTDAAVKAHYRAVADASPVPILLYSVPKFTHYQLPVEVVGSLSEHDNIVGIKDSSGDLEWLARVVDRSSDGFQVVCGSASVFCEALERGAGAGILAAANLLPEVFVKIHRLAAGGKRNDAIALQRSASPASDLAVSTHGVAGIKAAMDVRGLYGGPPRPPLLPASDETRDEIRREIDRLVDGGVLPVIEL